MEVQKARQEWGRVRSSRVWQLPCLCVLGALTEKVSRHGHMCHTPPIPATASPPASHDSPPNASISSSLVAISYLLLSLWFVRGFLSSLQSPLAFREVQTRFLLTKRKEKNTSYCYSQYIRYICKNVFGYWIFECSTYLLNYDAGLSWDLD